jgi:hypothetical protein
MTSTLDSLPADPGPILDRPPAGPGSTLGPKNRSQLGNGAFYDGRVDGRSAGARRFREVLTGYHEALGRDVGDIEQNLLRSAATLQLVIDAWEAEIIRGDLAHYNELKSALGQRDRMLRRVGILAAAHHGPETTTAGAYEADEEDDDL